MTCPRITHAIKVSRLSSSLKLTLRTLTDHVNSWKDPETGQVDYTRPATLEVYDAVATLAADTSYSKPTVMLHLLKLRGFRPIPGQPKEQWPQDESWAVLELIAKSRQHTAARYRLHLDRLEALQRSRNFTSEPSEDVDQRSKNLTPDATPAVKFSSSSGKVSLPDYSPSFPQSKKNFLAPARKTNKTRSDFTHAPDHLTLPDDFAAWFSTEVPELDLGKEREAFLGHCRRHKILNRYWDAAFQDWLLKAHARWQRGEPCASYPQPGQRTTHVTATRTTCSWNGCDRPPCGHVGQACWDHGCCEVCDPALRAANQAWGELMAEEPDPAAAAAAEPARVPTIEPPPPRAEAGVVATEATPAVPEAEHIPVTVAAALVQDFAGSHAMPPVFQAPRPLGSVPPRRETARSWLREALQGEDQPTYREAMERRRAQAAHLHAAPVAAD